MTIERKIIAILVAFILGMLLTATPLSRFAVGGRATAEPAPVAYWPFDGDYLDASGNGHHGTPSGDPVFVAGAVGQGLDLDGDGDYVTVGDSPPGLDGMNALTIDLWLYLRSYPASKTGLVTKWGPAFTSDDSYELTLFASGQLEIKVFDGRHNVGLGIWKTTNSLPTGEWVHITETWQATDDLHIYWNGIEEPIFQDPCPLCAYDTQFIQDTSIDSWMGRYEFSALPGSWLDGIIDEVKIYNSVVTPSANAPPVADANGPYEAHPHEAVQFSSAGSFDPDGDTLTYRWQVLPTLAITTANPTFSYEQPGAYEVTLTVTDPAGASASDTAWVSVGAEGLSTCHQVNILLNGISDGVGLLLLGRVPSVPGPSTTGQPSVNWAFCEYPDEVSTEELAICLSQISIGDFAAAFFGRTRIDCDAIAPR